MARDYVKELAEAEAKVARIRKAKEAAERRRYEMVGQALFQYFDKELNGRDSAREVKQFVSVLRDIYDDAHSVESNAEMSDQQSDVNNGVSMNDIAPVNNPDTSVPMANKNISTTENDAANEPNVIPSSYLR